MIAMLAIGTACTTQAQDDDKKIKIRISKEVDGETRTFEGEYASEDEMRDDPAYREFAGDDNEFSVWFDGDEGMDRVIQLHRGSGNSFSFSMDDDDFFPRNFKKNFRFHHGGPNSFFFGDDDAIIDLRGFDSEEFEEELKEKMEALQEKLKDLDKDLQEQIMSSMKEIEELHSSMGMPRRIHRGGISISDVEDEFGKRGKVAGSEELELDDLDFMVMRNRLTVRFKVKDESDLSVKISNEDGKDIYSRFFDSFGGTFSDSIDFSRYEDGNYLLEIQKGKKRLTKKIVID